MSQQPLNASPPPFSGSLNDHSPAKAFALLSANEQQRRLELLAEELGQGVDETKALLAFTWVGWLSRPSQHEPGGDWLFWLVKAGRGYGKTRIGAEWVRQQVKRFGRVALMGQDAGSVRGEMIEGESGILAVCPTAERPEYQVSKRQLVWPNGAISEIRTGEDPEGVRGLQCERLWADEIAAWQYPQEAWDMALYGLRLGPDPRALITSTPKPIGVVRSLVNDPDCVVTSGSSYENLDNLGPSYRRIIGRYEGTRLGRQEIHAELLEDEGLAYRFHERVHVVQPFGIPDAWERFEHMDYGLSAPTAWYAVAVDFDGNLIVFDGIYQPGLPSELAPLVKERRLGLWRSTLCYADPAVFAPGARTKWGRPASVADEFADEDVPLLPANNDRRAGFVRISELLKFDEGNRFPAWHEHVGEPGAPSMFIMDVPGTLELREQLSDAPLEEDGKPLPGEAIDRDWERSRGHAHASLRYGVLSRPAPSTEPERSIEELLLAPPDIVDVRAHRIAERVAQAEKPKRRRAIIN